MTALPDKVFESIGEKHVHLYRIARAEVRSWDQRRRRGDTAVFCGWYWQRGHDSGGPFPTRSAAAREVYYRFVLKREPPSVLPFKPVLHFMRKTVGRSSNA